MNPSAQGLDPKLKETYDRIMGTEVIKQPSAPVSEAKQEETPSSEHVFVASGTPSPSSQHQAFTVKKPFKISPIVLGVLGVAFFGIYTLVWLKVFGIF